MIFCRVYVLHSPDPLWLVLLCSLHWWARLCSGKGLQPSQVAMPTECQDCSGEHAVVLSMTKR
jgi:hypothetical protein